MLKRLVWPALLARVTLAVFLTTIITLLGIGAARHGVIPLAIATVAVAVAPKVRYLTRRQAVDYLTHTRGLPISFSHFVKLCSWGEGPPPALEWCQHHLYTEAILDTWAESRCRRLSADQPETSPPAAETIPPANGTAPRRGRPRKTAGPAPAIASPAPRMDTALSQNMEGAQ